MSIRANQQEYQLPLANTPYLVLKENLTRIGLVIVNNNVAATILTSFGQPMTGIGIPFAPNEKRVMDFVTPTDALYIQSTLSNATVVIEEHVRVTP